MEFKDKLKEIFADHEDAAEFIQHYNEYVHMIDDIIDGPKDPELTLKMTNLASDLFSCPFYVANKSVLHVVEKLINNTYADSVLWENSKESWKINAASSLRHCGLDMFYAVVLLIGGRDALREISEQKRSFTFLEHLNDFLQERNCVVNK